MAVEKIVQRRSDLSNDKGTKQNPCNEYKFSLNGTRYAIDLTESEWNEKVLNALAGVTAFARVVGAANVSEGEDAPVGSPDDIRNWGRENGFEVQEKGKLAKALKDAYAAAHPAEDVSEATQDA